MNQLQEAFKKVGASFDLFAATWNGFSVVESPFITPGDMVVDKVNSQILIYKPTEIQRIVRLGFREAHPWFKDPLDPLKLVR